MHALHTPCRLGVSVRVRVQVLVRRESKEVLGGSCALIVPIPREVDNPKEALTVLGSGVNPCSEPPRTQTHVAPPPRMLTTRSTRPFLAADLWDLGPVELLGYPLAVSRFRPRQDGLVFVSFVLVSLRLSFFAS